MSHFTHLSNTYQGIYINLERSKDRNAYIQAHLQELELAPYFKRFEAIDGSLYAPPTSKHKLTNREKACFKSHLLAIEKHEHLGKHLHIVEDDTIMHLDTKKTLYHCLCEVHFDDFDIIFCGTTMWDLSAQLYDSCMQTNKFDYQLFDLGKPLNYSGLHSYLIHKNSIHKILKLLKKHKFTNSIDLVLRYFIENKVLKAYCIMPMLAKPNCDFVSNIDPLGSDRNPQHNLGQRAFLHEHFAHLYDLFYKGAKLEDIYHKIVASLHKQGVCTENTTNTPSILDLMAFLLKHSLAILGQHHNITLLPDPKID